MKTVNELERELQTTTNEKDYDRLSKEIGEARRREDIQAARQRVNLATDEANRLALRAADLQDLARRVEVEYSNLMDIDRELFEIVPRFLRLAEERVQRGFVVDGMHESAEALAQELRLPAPPRKEQSIFGGGTVRPPWKHNPDTSTFLRIWLQRVSDALKRSPDGEFRPEDIATGQRGSLGIDDVITPGFGDF